MSIRAKTTRKQGKVYEVIVSTHRTGHPSTYYNVGTYEDVEEAIWVNEWLKESLAWDKEILKERERSRKDAIPTQVEHAGETEVSSYW